MDKVSTHRAMSPDVPVRDLRIALLVPVYRYRMVREGGREG